VSGPSAVPFRQRKKARGSEEKRQDKSKGGDQEAKEKEKERDKTKEKEKEKPKERFKPRAETSVGEKRKRSIDMEETDDEIEDEDEEGDQKAEKKKSRSSNSSSSRLSKGGKRQKPERISEGKNPHCKELPDRSLQRRFICIYPRTEQNFGQDIDGEPPCEHDFGTRQECQNHIRSKHTKERLMCPYPECDRGYFDRQNLSKHTRDHERQN